MTCSLLIIIPSLAYQTTCERQWSNGTSCSCTDRKEKNFCLKQTTLWNHVVLPHHPNKQNTTLHFFITLPKSTSSLSSAMSSSSERRIRIYVSGIYYLLQADRPASIVSTQRSCRTRCAQVGQREYQSRSHWDAHLLSCSSEPVNTLRADSLTWLFSIGF